VRLVQHEAQRGVDPYVRLDALRQPARQRAQPLARRAVLGGGLRGELLQHLVEMPGQRQGELFLGREMAVKGALGEARTVRHVLEVGARVAVPGELGGGRVENQFMGAAGARLLGHRESLPVGEVRPGYHLKNTFLNALFLFPYVEYPHFRTRSSRMPHTDTDTVRVAAEHARLADRQRRLADDVVAGLTGTGLPRHFVPHRWGGAEGTFGAVLDAVAALAEGCTSAAWCAMLWAAHGRFAALLPEEGQRELWGATADIRIAAALMPPWGSAEPASHGWQLRGTWHCVSGVDFADWVLVAAPEPYEDGRRVRVFAVPAREVTVEDTWDSTGLRGTGSHTVVIRDAVVPHHLSFLQAELMRGSDNPAHARCHTAPAQLAGGILFCAPALGAARRALRVWSQWAAAKSAGSGRPNHDSAAVRDTLATASARIDAAGLLLERAARRADTEPVTDLLVAGNQRDAAVAAELLAGAVDRLFRTGGAHIRDAGGELQRLWRDVHTVTSHGVLRLEPVAAAYASAALGDASAAADARANAASRSR
jgi:two-component flavin-dependent monooxygenase